MKVLLTGANGFVGSHVLDRLLQRQIPTVALLRPNSDRTLVAKQLACIEVREGGLDAPAALDAALADVTHVIHCAGAIKALNLDGFMAVNHLGTRNLITAVNRRSAQIKRFLLVSSLAAAGPGTREHPRREADPAEPVSDYGRSKLAAEKEVTTTCTPEWTIIRPPAVYGPRDREFLRLFQAARSHLRPTFGGGRQELTLVFVLDLAAAIVAALTHPNGAREIFFAGSPEVVTARELVVRIAAELESWTIPLPLPLGVLWLACQWAEMNSRRSGRANVLSAQKWAELKSPGWVCESARLKSEVGYDCRTSLAEGIAQTRTWYQAQGWLGT